MRTFTLNSSDEIPAVGLGTWRYPPFQTRDAVEEALRIGYRHLDTAYGYFNEEEVGQGIRASGVPREDIWLTTKLDNSWHKRVSEALNASLKNLDTEYVDLFLMHWPSSTDPTDSKKHCQNWDFCDTWRDMQSLLSTGKVRNIGVSNFGIKNLEKLLAAPDTKFIPAVNQIELHPYNPSPKLVAFCKEKGIHCTGYSCLGSNSIVSSNEHLLTIASARSKTPQQVMLMWGLQNGWSIIPRSITPKRIKSNWQLDDWNLTDNEMETLNNIKDRFKICQDDWLPVKVFFGDDE